MQQYLLWSSLDNCHSATSYKYSLTYVIIRVDVLLVSKRKGANHSLESFEKINSVIYRKLYFFTFLYKKKKSQTLLCGTETRITLFNSPTDYCTIKNRVWRDNESCFAKILLEFFHDVRNTVHPYKHHSHGQTQSKTGLYRAMGALD